MLFLKKRREASYSLPNLMTEQAVNCGGCKWWGNDLNHDVGSSQGIRVCSNPKFNFKYNYSSDSPEDYINFNKSYEVMGFYSSPDFSCGYGERPLKSGKR